MGLYWPLRFKEVKALEEVLLHVEAVGLLEVVWQVHLVRLLYNRSALTTLLHVCQKNIVLIGAEGMDSAVLCYCEALVFTAVDLADGVHAFDLAGFATEPIELDVGMAELAFAVDAPTPDMASNIQRKNVLLTARYISKVERADLAWQLDFSDVYVAPVSFHVVLNQAVSILARADEAT